MNVLILKTQQVMKQNCLGLKVLVVTFLWNTVNVLVVQNTLSERGYICDNWTSQQHHMHSSWVRPINMLIVISFVDPKCPVCSCTFCPLPFNKVKQRLGTLQWVTSVCQYMHVCQCMHAPFEQDAMAKTIMIQLHINSLWHYYIMAMIDWILLAWQPS